MDPFDKKSGNKAKRKEAQQIIQKWDADAKKGKNDGLKACPGYKDHSNQKRIPLTIPCPTCKRHFCSKECQEGHKELCEAKSYASESKDYAFLVDLCKDIVGRYIDRDGNIKNMWIETHNLDKRSLWYAFHVLGREHGELAEALKILKKRDREFHDNIKGNIHGFLW